VVVGYRSSEPILGKSQEGPVAALQTSLLVDSHGYVYESPYRGIRADSSSDVSRPFATDVPWS